MTELKRKGASSLTNRVRIIGGEFRSRMIEFPSADGLRPTPDRVRETLFNWLGQTLYGKRCLDLFAGSGVLGFEALSRGALRVVMVESNRAAFQAMKNNAQLLKTAGAAIENRDALQFARQCDEQFDVIFLDPPYGAGLVLPALAACKPLLAPQGCVYVETDERAAEFPGWDLFKSSRAGRVSFHLARPIIDQGAA